MARLYRVGTSGQLFEASEKPFASETVDMEEFVKNNPKVMGDLFIFSEQTISAGRDKRTDFLAVNRDGEIVIVELKKSLVNSNVLGQVLGYRLYWKRNIEAVKNLWNESQKKPEGIQPNFSNFDPTILLIAPEFEEELTEIVSLEGLPIEFVEISRYEYDNSTFVLVNPIEALPTKTRMGTVIGKIDYDWNYYANEWTPSQVVIAQNLYNQLLSIAQKKNWNLAPKFNKFYIGFKHGNDLVFQVDFRHSGKATLSCQRLNDSSRPPNTPKLKWNWDKTWEYWFADFANTDINLHEIEPVLDEAYQLAL